jgi:hypothetical protein
MGWVSVREVGCAQNSLAGVGVSHAIDGERKTQAAFVTSFACQISLDVAYARSGPPHMRCICSGWDKGCQGTQGTHGFKISGMRVHHAQSRGLGQDRLR